MADQPEKPQRSVHPVTAALWPVSREIGALQEAAVFLLARSEYTRRNSGDPVTAAEVEEKRQALLRAHALFDATVSQFPERLRTDTRLNDVRTALARLKASLERIAVSAGPTVSHPPK